MTARQKGRRDQAARNAWRPRVEAGLEVCWRCRQPILPDQRWDLGHLEDIATGGSPTGPRRPEHALKRDCPAGGNRSLGHRLGVALVTGRHPARRRRLEDWIEPTNTGPTARVVIVAGPPCAGKTTYVEEHAHPTDTIICFDTIAHQLGHVGPGRPPWTIGRRAEEAVQQRVQDIELGMITGTVYLIRTLAGPSRREALARRLDATVVLLVPDPDELDRRAALRPDPATTRRDIRRWFEHEAAG